MDRTAADKERRRGQPLKDLLASDGGSDAWGLPDASF